MQFVASVLKVIVPVVEPVPDPKDIVLAFTLAQDGAFLTKIVVSTSRAKRVSLSTFFEWI